MKINKFWKSLALLTPVVGATCSITSCNLFKKKEEDPPAEGTAREYIYSRTLSLNCEGSTGSIIGTCWVLSDATPNDTTDFEYYIATNWHVKYAAQYYFGSNINYKFGDSVSGAVNNYTTFSSFSWMSENASCYVSGDKTKAIDFYVAKVKLGNNMPSRIKTKLTKLNNQQKEKGYINKFGDLVDSSNNYANKKMYIGGYPVKGNNIEWRYNEVDSGKMMYYAKNYIFSGSTPGHPIDKNGNIVDISPQYGYTSADILCEEDSEGEWSPIDSYWGLSGGSSGSMVIANIDGEWNIVGIYWGGLTATIPGSSNVYFLPMASLFHSADKDFTTPYIQ